MTLQITVTSHFLTTSIDEAKKAKCLQKEIRSIERLRAKKHQDFVNMTDDEILSMATHLNNLYQHNYTVYTKKEN